ncbi:Uncharacterized protein EJ110_NYTH17317 [Nymphaea thermarum]|nr:Uncharacterized protein EJ110_NYTH17317 [Nymphaea thermarum]
MGIDMFHLIKVELAKVETMLPWKRPKNIIEIRSFVCLVGYYKRFIQNFSHVVVPLNYCRKY